MKSKAKKVRTDCVLIKCLDFNLIKGFYHLVVTWKKWRHLFQVTVTSSDVTSLTICSKWCKIAQNTKVKQKKISKILRCDVTSEVTGRWPRKWRHLKWPSFEKSDVTSFKWRADGQSQCPNCLVYILDLILDITSRGISIGFIFKTIFLN